MSRLSAPSFGQNFDGMKLNQRVPLGDDNGNLEVDAADYVLWRKTLATVDDGLAADGDLDGTVNAGDEGLWRSNFGSTPTSGIGAGANVALPEPPTLLLLILAAAGCCLRIREAE